MRAEALIQLRKAIGNADAQFRDRQFDAIAALVERRARLLVVQRTGWGKSLVYFLATHFLRQRGAGCTVLISPLLSLMRNQIAAARNIGVRAETINSTNETDWPTIESKLRQNQIDLLLISPERLGNDEFVNRCLLPIANRVGLFVVDEAHCISDWGHDFRPDYQRIVRILRALPRNVPVLATTATANDRVVEDIVEQLGPNLEVQRGPLARESLRLQNIRLHSQEERLAWLANVLPSLLGSGIVYTLTVKDSERVAEWIRSQDMDAEPYHAHLETEQREELENRLLSNDVKVLVATVALGMGFDKPDLGFVVHFQRPASVVHYYQQVGRAGRAIENAHCVLLNGDEDDDIANYFMRTSFPAPRDVEQLLAALRCAHGAKTVPQMQQRLNLSRRELHKILKFLLIQSPSPVQQTKEGYLLNPVHWQMPVEQIERIMQLRRREQEQMNAYMTSRSCLMQFLANELNDPNARPCGKCAICTGPALPETYPKELEKMAKEFLECPEENPVFPRKQWPPYCCDPQMSGKIPVGQLAREGRSLCRWGDAGLGCLVRRGKQQDHHFDDRLVDAAARLLMNRWSRDPEPTWIACVPSRRHQTLVPDFVRRLAQRLGLPFVECIHKVHETEPQKSRANSFHQAQNLRGAFTVDRAIVRKGAVLLVDDMVDSRWTFTTLAVFVAPSRKWPGLSVCLGRQFPAE